MIKLSSKSSVVILAGVIFVIAVFYCGMLSGRLQSPAPPIISPSTSSILAIIEAFKPAPPAYDPMSTLGVAVSALSVIVAVLGLIIAVAAIFGYTALRDTAKDVAKEVAREAALKEIRGRQAEYATASAARQDPDLTRAGPERGEADALARAMTVENETGTN